MKNIFIGCSMNDNSNDNYCLESQVFLSKLMINNNLVFGACNSGIMKIAYTETKKNNNLVTGIAPKCYITDLQELKCDKEIITNNVQERFIEIIKNSDILMFLPGGYGTLCELFFMIDSKKAKEHDKPIIICNINGYFDLLLEFLEKSYTLNFSKITDKNLYSVINNYTELDNYLN